MCDVPSIVVHCSEYTEHFPGLASNFFFKPFVTIPVTNYYLYDHTFQVPQMLHLQSALLLSLKVPGKQIHPPPLQVPQQGPYGEIYLFLEPCWMCHYVS